jgi:hypothetical protein
MNKTTQNIAHVFGEAWRDYDERKQAMAPDYRAGYLDALLMLDKHIKRVVSLSDPQFREGDYMQEINQVREGDTA